MHADHIVRRIFQITIEAGISKEFFSVGEYACAPPCRDSHFSGKEQSHMDPGVLRLQHMLLAYANKPYTRNETLYIERHIALGELLPLLETRPLAFFVRLAVCQEK